MVKGIVGYGVYIPRYRITRQEIGQAWGGKGGQGTVAVAATDEDVITMGAEAAGNALAPAGADAAGVQALWLATTSAPYAEHSSAGVLREVLGLPETADVGDSSTSPRAAVVAMTAGLDAVASGRLQRALVVGADLRSGTPGTDLEAQFGAGAGALLLGTEGVLAVVEGQASYSAEIMDRWRPAGEEHVEEYEPRFTRSYGFNKHVQQAGKNLLGKLGRSAADYRFIVLQAPDARQSAAVTTALGARAEQVISDRLLLGVGDLGAATVPVGLALALEQAEPGDRILLLSYGSGTADAVSLQATEALPGYRAQARSGEVYLRETRSVDYLTYLKRRGILREPGVAAPMIVPPSSPQLWRDQAGLLRLHGNKCKACGYMNFPPSQRKICIRCGGTDLALTPISRQGRVHTYSVNYYLPAPLESPTPVIIADLADGTRHRALGTEMSDSDVHVDAEVELVLRKVAEERGLGLYGFKFRRPRTAG